MARPRKSPAEQKAADIHPQDPQQDRQDQQALQDQQDQQALQKQVPQVQAQELVPTDQTGADAPAMVAVPVAAPEPEPLEAFLRRVERVHIGRDVVATAATHPHATQRVWPGTYGGIRLEVGPLSVTYSDGSTA